MAITPEQIKHQEFPIRLKGYDPQAVRAFLLDIGSAYRATIRDSGAQWALTNISDDMAAVLRAAHDAAETVIASAEAEAADIRAKAELESTVIRREADTYVETTRADADAEAARAIEVLKRTQGKADGVTRDAGEARMLLAEAQAKGEAILATAEAAAIATRRAAETHAERIEAQLADIDSITGRAAAAEALHAAATEDREAARQLLERTDTTAQTMLIEAEEQAAAIKRLAERDARARVLQIQEQAIEIGNLAESEARDRVQAVLAEGQRRLDAVEENERRLQERLLLAQEEFQGIVRRLGSMADTTIDLTVEPVAVLGGRYEEGRLDGLDDEAEPEFLQRMVSAAVGRAVDHSR